MRRRFSSLEGRRAYSFEFYQSSAQTFQGLKATKPFCAWRVVRSIRIDAIGGGVTKTVLLEPRTTRTPFVAWQFVGQPYHEWPSWVQSCCSLQRDADGRLELRHERRSGIQIVYLDEWLVRDLDGGVFFYTDAEISMKFETWRR